MVKKNTKKLKKFYSQTKLLEIKYYLMIMMIIMIYKNKRKVYRK